MIAQCQSYRCFEGAMHDRSRAPRQRRDSMTRLASLIAAAAFVGWAAAPAAAQDQYPQQYPQQYQEPYQQPYPQQYPQPAPGYGYDQQYGGPDQGANALG